MVVAEKAWQAPSWLALVPTGAQRLLLSFGLEPVAGGFALVRPVQATKPVLNDAYRWLGRWLHQVAPEVIVRHRYFANLPIRAHLKMTPTNGTLLGDEELARMAQRVWDLWNGMVG